MKTDRDMTERQFTDALQRHGMRCTLGLFGYVDIGVPGHHIEVSRLNAGPRRRSQLAYLLAKQAKETRECKACGHIYADHFKLAKDDKGRPIVKRPCPSPAHVWEEFQA